MGRSRRGGRSRTIGWRWRVDLLSQRAEPVDELALGLTLFPEGIVRMLLSVQSVKHMTDDVYR